MPHSLAATAAAWRLHMPVPEPVPPGLPEPPPLPPEDIEPIGDPPPADDVLPVPPVREPPRPPAGDVPERVGRRRRTALRVRRRPLPPSLRCPHTARLSSPIPA